MAIQGKRFYQRQRMEAFADPAVVSREFGYSPKHLEALIQLGIRVRAGSYINEGDLKLLVEAHPAVHPEAVLQAVRQVNMTPKESRFDAFVSTITASDGSDQAYGRAVELVSNYETASVEVALDSRLEKADVIADKARTFGVPKTAGASKPDPRFPREAVTTRDLIEAQVRPRVRVTPGEVLDKAADKVEANALRRVVNNASDTPDERGRDVAAAYDAVASVEVGKEFGVLSEDETAYTGEV